MSSKPPMSQHPQETQERERQEQEQTSIEFDLLEEVLGDLLHRDPDEAKKYIEGYRQFEGQ